MNEKSRNRRVAEHPFSKGLGLGRAPRSGPRKRVSDRTRLCDFYGRDFIISKDVLIPRPETEMMVDAVLNLVGKPYLPGVKPAKPKLPQDLTILDVGTGSGCIAITLKLELPNAAVTACDISEHALNIARQNAAKFKADVDFKQSNLLSNIASIPDLIVANLPYVDESWGWLDKESLSKEPSIALYAEDHGLALIKQLIKESSSRNIKYLILESDPCQHDQLTTYANNHNYDLLETRGYAQVYKLETSFTE